MSANSAVVQTSGAAFLPLLPKDASVLGVLVPHAGQMPLTVIGTMLGVPREDHVQVKAWASALGGIADLDPTPEVLERALQALEAFRD
jgi:cytochrome P450